MMTTITKKNSDIVKTFIVIIIDKRIYIDILITLKRLFVGVLGAIIIGGILGLVIGFNLKIRNLFKPIFHIIQATPPISWLALAMIWFGLDGEASIFIVFIASVPIFIISIVEGFENIDSKLIEMGNMFKFSKNQMLFEVILPSLKSYIKSGIIRIFISKINRDCIRFRLKIVSANAI